MIEDVFSFLTTALSGSFTLAIIASFSWGILSILLSPCHLSGIPLVIGFITSQGTISIKKTFYISLVFAVGILITIATIGLITASLGRLMGDIGVYGNYIVAGIFFLIGLYLLDIIKLPGYTMGPKTTRKKGLLAAFTLGLLFGIGLGPCTFAYMAPILGVVFQVARSNLIYSIVLLLAFGIGHCAVIVLEGTLTKKVQQYLNWSEGSKVILYIKKVCGVLVIFGGVYMIYNLY